MDGQTKSLLELRAQNWKCTGNFSLSWTLSIWTVFVASKCPKLRLSRQCPAMTVPLPFDAFLLVAQAKSATRTAFMKPKQWWLRQTWSINSTNKASCCQPEKNSTVQGSATEGVTNHYNQQITHDQSHSTHRYDQLLRTLIATTEQPQQPIDCYNWSITPDQSRLTDQPLHSSTPWCRQWQRNFFRMILSNWYVNSKLLTRWDDPSWVGGRFLISSRFLLISSLWRSKTGSRRSSATPLKVSKPRKSRPEKGAET